MTICDLNFICKAHLSSMSNIQGPCLGGIFVLGPVSVGACLSGAYMS